MRGLRYWLLLLAASLLRHKIIGALLGKSLRLRQ
jgi:hypothetical protein